MVGLDRAFIKDLAVQHLGEPIGPGPGLLKGIRLKMDGGNGGLRFRRPSRYTGGAIDTEWCEG